MDLGTIPKYHVSTYAYKILHGTFTETYVKNLKTDRLEKTLTKLISFAKISRDLNAGADTENRPEWWPSDWKFENLDSIKKNRKGKEWIKTLRDLVVNSISFYRKSPVDLQMLKAIQKCDCKDLKRKRTKKTRPLVEKKGYEKECDLEIFERKAEINLRDLEEDCLKDKQSPLCELGNNNEGFFNGLQFDSSMSVREPFPINEIVARSIKNLQGKPQGSPQKVTEGDSQKEIKEEKTNQEKTTQQTEKGFQNNAGEMLQNQMLRGCSKERSEIDKTATNEDSKIETNKTSKDILVTTESQSRQANRINSRSRANSSRPVSRAEKAKERRCSNLSEQAETQQPDVHTMIQTTDEISQPTTNGTNVLISKEETVAGVSIQTTEVEIKVRRMRTRSVRSDDNFEEAGNQFNRRNSINGIELGSQTETTKNEKCLIVRIETMDEERINGLESKNKEEVSNSRKITKGKTNRKKVDVLNSKTRIMNRRKIDDLNIASGKSIEDLDNKMDASEIKLQNETIPSTVIDLTASTSTTIATQDEDVAMASLGLFREKGNKVKVNEIQQSQDVNTRSMFGDSLNKTEIIKNDNIETIKESIDIEQEMKLEDIQNGEESKNHANGCLHSCRSIPINEVETQKWKGESVGVNIENTSKTKAEMNATRIDSKIKLDIITRKRKRVNYCEIDLTQENILKEQLKPVVVLRDILRPVVQKPVEKETYMDYFKLQPSSPADEPNPDTRSKLNENIRYSNSIPFSSNLGKLLTDRTRYKLTQEIADRKTKKLDYYLNENRIVPTAKEYEVSFTRAAESKKEKRFYNFPSRTFRGSKSYVKLLKKTFCKPVSVRVARTNFDEFYYKKYNCRKCHVVIEKESSG